VYQGFGISAQGLCLEHGIARMEANNRQISPQTRDSGPFSDHWRRRTIEAFGGVVPESELG
jgi:hypothetical protein